MKVEFEQKLKELEKIVEKLGSGELSLQESLRSFEKGVKLSRECSKELNQSEKKVQKLIVDAKGEIKTTDFEKNDESESDYERDDES